MADSKDPTTSKSRGRKVRDAAKGVIPQPDLLTVRPRPTQRPEAKPSEAGLAGGDLMRRGDAKHRRAARRGTWADRPWSARAPPARVFGAKRRT